MAPYLPSVKDFGASGSAARASGKANGTALAVADVMDFRAGQAVLGWLQDAEGCFYLQMRDAGRGNRLHVNRCRKSRYSQEAGRCASA